MDYPPEYVWIRGQDFRLLRPWEFVDESTGLDAEFARETAPPNPTVIKQIRTFARRQDCDEVAGFVVEDGRCGGRIVTVHLTWRGQSELPGWPGLAVSPSIWDWLRDVMLVEARDWGGEEDWEL